ncbi:hypothetical protein FGB62_53g04 [Gracilaria domingensis]|nr:hypothetical protein FGB62_53g04 [Gracilaria domingensis]
MKPFTIFFLLFAASIALAFGSAVPDTTETEDDCNVPPVVSYCLDLLHLGAGYEPPTAEVVELQHDVEEVPLGMCSWGDWAGTASVEDCMKILAVYADMDEETEEIDIELETTGRFFKKIKKAIKKVGKKIKKGVKKVAKGVKKVAKGVKKVVKKVGKFCKKNPDICEAAVEIGKGLLGGEEKKTSWK